MVVLMVGCSSKLENNQDEIDKIISSDSSNSVSQNIMLTNLKEMTELEDIYYKTLRKDTELETNVYLIDSGIEGPNVMLIGGTHGDEKAGWKAAELMLSYRPEKGKLLILPWANILGVKEDSRLVYDDLDLNRSYTGVENENANSLELLANEIIEVIEEFDPVVVIDNHESRDFYTTPPRMGNTIIFADVGDNAFIVMEIIEQINKMELVSVPFTFIGPPKKNSLNDYVSNVMNIPIFTIETTRTNPLNVRINQQIQIAKIIMKKYGMEITDRQWIIKKDDEKFN